MIRKRLFVFTACCVLSLLLSGCANNARGTVSEAASKVGEAVSRVGEDVSETMSRAESFLEGSHSRTESSRLDNDTDSSRLGDDLNSSSYLPESSSHMGSEASSGLS